MPRLDALTVEECQLSWPVIHTGPIPGIGKGAGVAGPRTGRGAGPKEVAVLGPTAGTLDASGYACMARRPI